MLIQRRRLTLLGAVGGLALGAAAVGGVVLAQSPGGSNPPAQGQRAGPRGQAEEQYLNSLAQHLGIDRAKLNDALKLAANDQLAAAVASGKLTQAQADQIKAQIAAGKVPFGALDHVGAGRGPRGGMPGGLAGGPAGGQAIQDALNGALAKALPGESAAQLQADLKAGKSLDTIAKEHGTTAQAVRDSLATSAQAALAPLVANGTITQAQADQIIAGVKSGNGPFGMIGAGFPGGRRGPGNRGPGGQNGSGTTQNGAPTS